MNNNYQGHNIVFILGCPRSGTTWLQRLLMCHPKIRSGQESDVFNMFVGPQIRAWQIEMKPELSGRPVGLAAYFTQKEYFALLRRYLLDLLEPMVGGLKADEIFVEKSPSHALFVQEIMVMLPEARIIHILRDPRDVVTSLLAASKAWGCYWAPKDAQRAAQMWIEHVQSVKGAITQIPKGSFFELRYEDLYLHPRRMLKKLCAFLKFDWEDEGVDNAIKNNELEIAQKTGGTPIPISGELALMFGHKTKEPSGFVRKGKPGIWRDELSDIQLRTTMDIAGQMMTQTGYA